MALPTEPMVGQQVERTSGWHHFGRYVFWIAVGLLLAWLVLASMTASL